ncbi:unnamed protein product, partial [Mycena citricolor]
LSSQLMRPHLMVAVCVGSLLSQVSDLCPRYLLDASLTDLSRACLPRPPHPARAAHTPAFAPGAAHGQISTAAPQHQGDALSSRTVSSPTVLQLPRD